MDSSLIIFLILTALVICITFIVLFIISLDSDLTLYFAEKFGKSISVLKGKVVWITGASSGIGESLAYLLTKNGCKLIISATNKDRLDNVRLNCIAQGISDKDILALDFDMKDFEAHSEMVEKAIKTFGRIDVLINNAGRSQRASFNKIDVAVDEEMYKINTLGPVCLTRLVLNHWELTNSAGAIAVVTSVAGKLGAPFSASYTGSKHALHGYFECLRVESIGKSIKITMCCPGPVESRVLENAYTGQPGEIVGRKHPKEMKRMSSDRCAKLIAVSIANQLDEAWMSIQPPLMLLYFNQYTPSIFKFLSSFIFSPEVANKMRDG